MSLLRLAPVLRHVRGMSTSSVGGAGLSVFDRRAKRAQKNIAARQPNYNDYLRLREEIAWQISDRISDVNRSFSLGLDLGCNSGQLGKHLDKDLVQTLVQCDIAQENLYKFSKEEGRDQNLRVVCDEEFLPFAENTFDLVASNLALHWVNDLPSTLAQIKRVLKPDGLFIASMFCGDTLYELRCALQLAETERTGGFSPRISPYTDMKDVGNLLQRAGFSLLTVDIEDVIINFPSPFEVMDDVRGMGEGNAIMKRRGVLGRETLLAAAAIYQEMYGSEGNVPATFEIAHMVGWKPDPSQQQSAKRGSATRSLKELGVDVDELTKNMKE